MRLSKRRKSGFTLFEVLLVIAILALLAAFVVPQFMGIGEQAKKDLAASAVGRTGPIAKALDFYKNAMGVYPEGEEGLQYLIESPEDIIDDDKLLERWAGPYIEGAESLKDPWNNEYNYRFPGEFNEKSFELWSNGPDGEEDTEDDIVSWDRDDE
jgi:general secretion pathway protein G